MSTPTLDSEGERGIATDQLSGVRIARVLFFVTMLGGAALIWIAPRLPLCDLPQHAAQVALLRDLLAHQSPWESIVRINFFTPYLTGYSLALLLSYAMPITAAFKALLTVAYFAFVAASLLLRRHFDGDERLDWMFIPGFFGFAFGWGFVTFLIATPVGLLFVLFADRYAAAPTTRRALGLVLLGVVLFFSHGLVFLFACAVGGLALLIRQRRIASIARAIGPFVLLGALALGYGIVTQERDPLIGLNHYLPHSDWGPLARRPFEFVLYPLTSNGSFTHDPWLVLLSLVMLAVPWLLRDRINLRAPTAVVPFIMIVCIYLFVPDTAMKTSYLFQRFAIFILPTYALMFRAPEPRSFRSGTSRGLLSKRRLPDGVIWLTLMIGCWIYLTAQAVRMERFATESAPFETILDSMEPGQRALSLVFQKSSAGYDSEVAYLHYPLWYQAERHGFVDMNFAWFLPQIARFRQDQLPAIRPLFELAPAAFNWQRDGGRQYRYFVVRNSQRMPAGFFANDECDVQLVRTAADWSLYERKTCR